ncbi:hypothetical protein [Actinoplanes lobatus]|nr:hypothetical protein [Actinoplanes lobatus]MBB4747693.1 hypothetical protein [Actinoplanes lobatus]
MSIAEIHTPCDAGDSPLPEVCRNPNHVNRLAVDKRHRNRCRVAQLRPGGQLWFGAQRPEDGRDWLQVGRATPDLPSAVSKVVGRIWFTAPADGARVLVENLSGNNILELRSPRLPQPVSLYPAVPADPGGFPAEILATPMVAIQAASTMLTILNKSTDFVVWIEAPIRTAPANDPGFTSNPRAPLNEREQRELDDAALRVQLAARENLPLLKSFLDREDVRDRLRSSESLQAFLAKSGIGVQAYIERELTNVAERRPTHEIHRLILEAVGTSPEFAPKWYTNLVANHLDPDRSANSRPGGSTGGLTELIPMVKGLWGFRRYQLEEYLTRERGLGIGRDLG